MKTYQQYINGAWVAPLNGKYTEVYNPSDDSVVGMVANGDEKDADLALQAAQAAQKSWAKLTARRRAEILYAFIEEIKKNKEELARMISTEQGKLFKVAQFEVDVCCSFIAYACEWARRIEGDIVPSDNPNEHLMIQKIPRGVVVAITAWNFPLALAGRKIGPALVAGNTIVVKPTTETPIATLMLGEMAKKVGLDGRIRNYVPDNDTGFFVLITALFAEIHAECPNCSAYKFLKVVGRYLQVDGAVDAVLRKIHTETAGIGEYCYLCAAAVLHTELTDTFGRKVGDSFL